MADQERRPEGIPGTVSTRASEMAADVAAKLAALREQFHQRMENTLKGLEEKLDDGPEGLDSEALKEVHLTLHKLAGSSGTFGFSKLSEKARNLEVAAKEWLDAGGSITGERWSAWKSAILGLRHSAKIVDDQATGEQTEEAAAGAEGPIRLVLIEDDRELAGTLALGLSQFGYEVRHYVGFAEAEPAILADPPAGLLVDMMLMGQTPSDGTVGVKALFERMGRRLPTVFLTVRNDFAAKLSAARVQADAYLVKPVDVPVLAERIESVLTNGKSSPFRVLIVDDDEVLAEHYRLTLTAAGFIAEKVTRPDRVLTAMESLNPDLLLLDLYMPECSGADLARAIRYDARWTGLPIVYLSGEGDLDLQVEALGSGADDFLTKPIADKRLVAAVRVRGQRARKIAALMSQDSLTGLLKHSSIKERIDQELDRARRQAKPMSVVMVDIDHFKQVNDTWGHPMGDQVIKTLAHLLRQRLRKQDSVGRYGGEEFAAVLSECSADDAKRLLDDIRERFARIRFTHAGVEFTATLSSGIACNENFPEGTNLLAAADKALYVAKHNGRNQVRVADAPADDDVDAQRALRTADGHGS